MIWYNKSDKTHTNFPTIEMINWDFNYDIMITFFLNP